MEKWERRRTERLSQRKTGRSAGDCALKDTRIIGCVHCNYIWQDTASFFLINSPPFKWRVFMNPYGYGC